MMRANVFSPAVNSFHATGSQREATAACRIHSTVNTHSSLVCVSFNQSQQRYVTGSRRTERQTDSVCHGLHQSGFESQPSTSLKAPPRMRENNFGGTKSSFYQMLWADESVSGWLGWLLHGWMDGWKEAFVFWGVRHSQTCWMFLNETVVKFNGAGLFLRQENAQLNAKANLINRSFQMLERCRWLINKLN